MSGISGIGACWSELRLEHSSIGGFFCAGGCSQPYMGAGDAAVVKRTMPLRAPMAWKLELPKMDIVRARRGLSSFALRRRWSPMLVGTIKRFGMLIWLTIRPQKSDMV